MTDDLLEVSGETVVAGVKAGTVRIDGTFTELADDRSVDADFKAAGRSLTPDLARVYADHIAAPDGDDDGLFEAHITVAALARIDGVQDEVHRAAAELAGKWLDEHRVGIKGLPDERRAVYDDIIAMTTEPQRIDLIRPTVRTEETEEADGILVPTVSKHLMSDAEGQFPIGSLNGWEKDVVNAELGRSIAWYRNPSRASADSLAVAYTDDQGNWRRMCPDFLFFGGSAAEIKVSIVDPHGHHLGDALGKLRGLSDFAEQFAADFHRIESVAKLGDTLRVLDLTLAATRAAVRGASDVQGLYEKYGATYV
jgi:hypothetical protein